MKILTLILVLLSIALPGRATATPSEDVMVGVERLQAEEDADYYNRLFVQCGSWLPQYEEVKEPAKAKLIELGPYVLETLIPTWYASTNVRHRVTLEEIIQGIGPGSVPYLTPYVADPDAVMRQRVVTSLGDLDDPAVLPVLRDRLALEDDVSVLPPLLDALGKRGVGQMDLLAPIGRLLGHPDERVRRSGAVALGRIGRHEAIPLLLPLLDDRVFSVRAPTQEALFGLYRKADLSLWSPRQSMPEASRIGNALLIELDVALLLLNRTGGFDDIERILRTDEIDPSEKQAVLRGIHRAWQVDHYNAPEALEWLQIEQSDPGPEAVRREILAAIEAQIAREVAIAEASP